MFSFPKVSVCFCGEDLPRDFGDVGEPFLHARVRVVPLQLFVLVWGVVYM
jgi:hypothetical protein